MRELSIFVDESGDFGFYEPHAPFYLFTLVFHDQSIAIEDQINHLERGLTDIGFAVHTAFTQDQSFAVRKIIRAFPSRSAEDA